LRRPRPPILPPTNHTGATGWAQPRYRFPAAADKDKVNHRLTFCGNSPFRAARRVSNLSTTDKLEPIDWPTRAPTSCIARRHDDRVLLYAFDLLELDGEDFRPKPLFARKARLERLLAKAPAGTQYNDRVEGDGATVFEHACKLGLESIVSKHRDHPYRSGRSKTWLKIKNPAAPGVTRFEWDDA
jgi:hypothetical protein